MKNNVEAPVETSTYFYFTICGLDSISKLGTGLELGHLLSSNRNLLLCSGVDTLTSGALANAECTKTNESNLVTCYESVLNSCDCGFKSLLRVYL